MSGSTRQFDGRIWVTILSNIQGRQANALIGSLCEHKPLLINALALLALPIGSVFTLLSESEELEAPKLLNIKDIRITAELSKVRGVRGWVYSVTATQERGGRGLLCT